MMTTTRILSSMPIAENVNIVDGALDKLVRPELYLESKRKRGRPRKEKKMATTNTSVEQTDKTNETDPNYQVGVPQENEPNTPEYSLTTTEYGFKLRPSGVYKVSKKIFDLDTLMRKTKYNTFQVSKIESKEELGQIKSDRLIALVNLGLQKESLMEAKSKIGADGNAKAVNDFINNFRILPQFNQTVNGVNLKEDRQAQKVAIMAFIKDMKLFDQLKAIASQPAEKKSDEDEDSDDTEE